MVRQRDIIQALKPCSEKPKTLCNDPNCKACPKKSFAGWIPSTIKIVDKNINPRQILKCCIEVLLFYCMTCKHTFNKKVFSLTRGEHCIYCTSKPIKLCDKKDCDFCYKKSFASHEKSNCWDYNKNKLTPRQVYRKSIEKIWCICDICNHSFESTPDRIVDGHFCPYCAKIKMCGDYKCITCFSKSFAMHPFALSWSIKNEVLPWEVFKGSSSKKYYFDCKNCGHELYVVLGGRNENTLNCLYCASKKICYKKNCEACLNNPCPDKTFANNTFSQHWSSKNDIEPKDVFNKTHKKFIFNCKNCLHEFETQISNINEDKLNCLYCAKFKMCYSDNCDFCFNQSFASQEKAKFWSNKNEAKPREVFKSTSDKYLFNCDRCKNEFSASLCGITGRNQWCPACVNKTELKLRDWLYEKYGDENVKTQFKFEHENHTYFYDFYIPKFNILIELDGLQHFKQVAKWKSPEHNLQNDINKIVLALENDITIIHLLQENVLHNRNNWEKKLVNCIKQYDEPSAIYINNNDIYKNHIDGVNKLM